MKLFTESLSRRGFLAGAAATGGLHAAAPASIGLAIGTYGMRSLTWKEALQLVRDTGYDGVELSLIAGWPTEPKALGTADRRDIREWVTEARLAVPAFLENLQIDGAGSRRTANLDRLKSAFELGHDISPKQAPLVETVLGGKTADWDRLKGAFVSELREWARIAEGAASVVCFKPHAAHAVHSPDRAMWLLQEVGSKHLRVVYDYSHMFIEGFGMEESMKALLPYAPFVHMKDASGTPENHTYLLPGDGQTDYARYFRLLKQYSYRGYATVEVSAMIHRKPDYQPVPAARLCYQRMTTAMAAARISRPGKRNSGYPK